MKLKFTLLLLLLFSASSAFANEAKEFDSYYSPDKFTGGLIGGRHINVYKSLNIGNISADDALKVITKETCKDPEFRQYIADLHQPVYYIYTASTKKTLILYIDQCPQIK